MLSLAITFVIVTSLTGFYRLIAHASSPQLHDEDLYIGIKQISQYVIGTKCVKADESYQYIDRDEEINEFIFERNRLVKKPGYQIILTDVDGTFEMRNDHIYIHIQRDDRDYCFLLTYKDMDGEGNETTEQ